MVLDWAIKSPDEEYQTLLRDAIKKSGKTQSRVADEAGIEPGNLSHILAGRRKPLRSYEKNLALSQACGQGERLAYDLQFAAEEYHTLAHQSRDFRRYMVVTTLALDSLLRKSIGALEAYNSFEESNENEKKVETSENYIPESLIAMGKIIEHLRYMWPIEPYERWDDYPGIKKQILRNLFKLTPSNQVKVIIGLEVKEALEWVYDQGDFDPFVEKSELVRRLASMLGVDEGALKDIIIGVEKLSNP